MDTRAYWEHRIADGDRYRSVGHTGYPAAVNRERKHRAWSSMRTALDRAGIDLDGADVLDVGCGTGIYAERFARRGATVTGLDFSRSAVEAVRRHEVPGSFLVASATDLPVPADRFDVVACISVLYHLVDDGNWRRAIGELRRVVRPGGHLLLRVSQVSQTRRTGDHVRVRSWRDYRRLLEDELGMEIAVIQKIGDEPISGHLSRLLPTLVCRLGLFQTNPDNVFLVARRPEATAEPDLVQATPTDPPASSRRRMPVTP